MKNAVSHPKQVIQKAKNTVKQKAKQASQKIVSSGSNFIRAVSKGGVKGGLSYIGNGAKKVYSSFKSYASEKTKEIRQTIKREMCTTTNRISSAFGKVDWNVVKKVVAGGAVSGGVGAAKGSLASSSASSIMKNPLAKSALENAADTAVGTIDDLAHGRDVSIGSIEIEGRSMDMQMHEIYSEQIAQQLIQKAYIPLQVEVTFEDVKNGYERYFKNPNKGTIVEYEDYVYISSWTRKKELFDNALHTVYNELKSWPEERYFVRDGGFKNWMLELEKKLVIMKY